MKFIGKSTNYFNFWTLATIGVAFLIAIPILFIFSQIFSPESEAWQALKRTPLLNTYFYNTLTLCFCVGSLTALLGVSCAWVVTTYQFPGRSFFEWALTLPLVIPVYIMAYTYSGIFEGTGFVQTQLRALTGWKLGEYSFFEFKSKAGLIFVFSFVLYPYVYLLAREAFRQYSVMILEVGKLFDYPPWRVFFRVALPLTFPSILLGVLLVMMEVLSDYGTIIYYGVPTYTAGIFKAWFGYEDINAAMRLAAKLLFFIFCLFGLCWIFLKRRKANQLHLHQFCPTKVYPLSKGKGILAFSVCMIPFLLGFLLPVLQLTQWMVQTLPVVEHSRYWELIRNSFFLALGSAFLAVAVAILISYTVKLYTNPLTVSCSRLATIGYTLPASVIAISVISVCHYYDTAIGYRTGWVLSNSLVALIFAYLVRFLTVGFQSVDAGFVKRGTHHDEVSFSLGRGAFSTLFRIHLPLMRYHLLSAFILVFIDVLKDFNLTFLVGLSFETLATRAYSLAITNGDASHSSTIALTIIATGMVVLLFSHFFLERQLKKEREGF